MQDRLPDHDRTQDGAVAALSAGCSQPLSSAGALTPRLRTEVTARILLKCILSLVHRGECPDKQTDDSSNHRPWQKTPFV